MSNDHERELAARLRSVIETWDVHASLSQPFTDAIRSLLSTSAAALASDEASVLVRDNDHGDLRFLVAIGKVADRLIDVKVPAGKGIAGFVFSSGQPMAVTDVGEDDAFYAEVDRQTGYSTQTVLATPLRYRGDVIGVLEFINRRGDPPYAPFTSDEMDQAAVYADAIGAMVNAFESSSLLSDFGTFVTSPDGDADDRAIREWLDDIRQSSDHRGRIELAILIREVVSRGDAEQRLCRELLETVIRYSDAKGEISFLG